MPAEPASASSPISALELRQRRLAVALFMAMYACMTIDRSIMAVLVEPVRAEFNVSDTQIGLISSFAFALCFGVAGIPLGVLADRWNRRKLLAACLAIWSALTICSGFANNFWQLLLARTGVGVAEAGGTPTALSMLSDLFPPDRRATAVSLMYLGGPVGTVIVFGGGGFLAAEYGWRTAFIVAGIPGLVLAAVTHMVLTEPKRGRFDGSGGDVYERVGLAATASYLWTTPSLFHMTLAITACALVLSAELMWLTAFFIRSHGMSLTSAGMLIAFGYGVISAVGVAGGGFIADRFMKPAASPTRVLTISCIFSIPALLILVLSPSLVFAMIGLSLWSITASMWYGPAYGLCQNLTPPKMRATLSAIIYFCTGVIGFALGPQIVGISSDLAAASLGTESLRAALVIPVLGHAFASWHYYRAGQSVLRECHQLAA